jgi:hypothetical protein
MYTELPNRHSVILDFQVKDPQILRRDGSISATEEGST